MNVLQTECGSKSTAASSIFVKYIHMMIKDLQMYYHNTDQMFMHDNVWSGTPVRRGP